MAERGVAKKPAPETKPRKKPASAATQRTTARSSSPGTTARSGRAAKADTSASASAKADRLVPVKKRSRSVGRTWQPASRAEFVTRVAGGTRKAADLLDVAASQPSRWVRGEALPGPTQARMLVDLDHVLAHALLVWADDEVARDWLTTPNAHLDGLRPVDWIRVNGTSGVVDALRAEAAGAFA